MSLFADRNQPIPQRTNTIAMWLFLASLGILFFASMLGYVLIRIGFFGREDEQPLSLGSLHLPWALWISTLIILLASVTMHRAVGAIRREKQAILRGYLLATFCLSIAFVIVQAPALFLVISGHHQLRGATGSNLYGLVFFLVLIHALHVIGGLTYLMLVLLKAYAGKYDHEHHVGVRHAALYWHFLDVVWIVMFGTMMVLR
jgi:heme/copper-type cytochrome/quinol oxidase subunit 3